jgi:FeS assembly SUF system regulator
MLRMTKQADYGIVLLSQMACNPTHRYTAPELAHETHLPLPMVSKIMKILSRSAILLSHRGAKGGYSLAEAPERINVARMLAALDGPIAFTECSDDASVGLCSQEASCRIRDNWRLINVAVRTALEAVSLAQLARPTSPALVQLGRSKSGPAVETTAVWDLLALPASAPASH